MNRWRNNWYGKGIGMGRLKEDLAFLCKHIQNPTPVLFQYIFLSRMLQTTEFWRRSWRTLSFTGVWFLCISLTTGRIKLLYANKLKENTAADCKRAVLSGFLWNSALVDLNLCIKDANLCWLITGERQLLTWIRPKAHIDAKLGRSLPGTNSQTAIGKKLNRGFKRHFPLFFDYIKRLQEQHLLRSPKKRLRLLIYI